MIVATYLEGPEYLENCFRLWQHSFSWADELWVGVPPGYKPPVEVPNLQVMEVPVRPLPWEYVGGHCTALATLPFPHEEEIWLTDPDVLCYYRPKSPLKEAQGHFALSALPLDPAKRIPMNPFNVPFEQGWEAIRKVVGITDKVPYFNTGVVVAKGRTLRSLASSYLYHMNFFYTRRELFGIGHWIAEQIAFSLSFGELWPAREFRPLPPEYNAMNHEHFLEDWGVTDPMLVHYCWKDRLGFNKKNDMLDLGEFVEGNSGGPLVARVREVAKKYMEER